jgi:hypothetical protein
MVLPALSKSWLAAAYTRRTDLLEHNRRECLLFILFDIKCAGGIPSFYASSCFVLTKRTAGAKHGASGYQSSATCQDPRELHVFLYLPMNPLSGVRHSIQILGEDGASESS